MKDDKKLSEPFILFELAKTTYAVRAELVQQMEMIETITPVPNAPKFVEGVVFSRGQVIPAIDLRVRLGLEKAKYDLRTRLIVIQTNNRTVGAIADSAREFVSIPVSSIQPPPEAIGASGKYISGIIRLGERIILLLNVEELLNTVEEVAELPAVKA
jgi:purine-binding chemotaxis protein CheW